MKYVLLLWAVFLFSCTNDDSGLKLRTDNTLRFFILGDWGREGTYNQLRVANAMQLLATDQTFDFILAVGDNFYPEGVGSAEDPHFKSSFENVYNGPLQNIPWYVTLGNHDYLGNPGAEIDYSGKNKRWHMPHYYYTLIFRMKDGQKIRLVVLDTSPLEKSYYGYPPMDTKFKIDTARQKAWMDSVFTLKDANWTLVAGHHPVYSAGFHSAEVQSVPGSLLPVFRKHELPVYFAGHEHDLQHLKSPDAPTHQFISGAGSEVRPSGSNALTRFSASAPGFIAAEVTGNTMSIFFIDYKLDTLYKTQLTR